LATSGGSGRWRTVVNGGGRWWRDEEEEKRRIKIVGFDS